MPGPARALAAGGSSQGVRRRGCFEGLLLSAVECFPPGAEGHQLGFAEQGAKARHQHHQKICTPPTAQEGGPWPFSAGDSREPSRPRLPPHQQGEGKGE